MADTIKADEFIRFALAQHCRKLGQQLKADVILVKSPIYRALDDHVRAVVERLVERNNEQEKKPKNSGRERLAVVLETPGGYVEVVERISDVFRNHYNQVEFVVPNHAYSAGTVLVLSGDKIYMDYYSVLGPIDPQVENDSGKFIPGMGYLYKYHELVNKKKLSQAELLFLVKRFDPAELFVIEQSQNHSEELIRKWLVQYKFKNWNHTATRKRRVTKAMKEKRAALIANILGNAARWHSHGRGITLRELEGDDIKLVIDNFGKDTKLNEAVRNYYDLFIDYCGKVGASTAIHTQFDFRTFGALE